MRHIRPFLRDIELHGHHDGCPLSTGYQMPEEFGPCICEALDHDDWIAACEAARDQQREEGKVVSDE